MPFLNVLLSILMELKNWILGGVGGVTVVVIAKEGLTYQQASAGEKEQIIKNIKNKFYMGGGIFFLVWFATYVIDKFKVVQ